MKIFKRLWRDSFGGVTSAELVLIGTILLIGVVPGIAVLRNAVVLELEEFARAISHSDVQHHDDDKREHPHPHPGKYGPIVTADKILNVD